MKFQKNIFHATNRTTNIETSDNLSFKIVKVVLKRRNNIFLKIGNSPPWSALPCAAEVIVAFRSEIEKFRKSFFEKLKVQKI